MQILLHWAGRGGGGGGGRGRRRGFAVHFPVVLDVVISFPFFSFHFPVRSGWLRSVLSSPLIGYYPCSQPERTSPLPGRHRPGPGGGRGCLGPITGLMVSPAGPEAVPAGSSNHSPVTGRIVQPCGWIVIL